MRSSEKSETKLHVDAPDSQRRLSVFFRIVLILPQLFVSVFLTYAIVLLTIPAWFIALFTGRNPFHRLTSDLLRWYYRILAYNYLLTDRYPPFRVVAPLYPIDIGFEETDLGRLSVFFRLILVLPATIVFSILSSGMALFALAAWLITLVRGEMPAALHGALSAQLRFSLRISSYLYLLQDAYPRGLFGDPDVAPALEVVAPTSDVAAATSEVPTDVETPDDEPEQVAVEPWSQDWTLRLSRGARRILVISLVLGIAVLPLSIYAEVKAMRHFRQSAGQSWSSRYEPRVATLNGDTKRAIVALASSPPSWSAISDACHNVSTDLQSLATVPQYPEHAANQLLLQGFSAIYRADLRCVGDVTGQQSSDLAAVAGEMQQGSTNLIAFLDSIPAP